MAYRGAIFDVDGVLVDSPHELAWRESFRKLMEGGVARGPRPDQLDARAVHPGGVPAGHGGQAAHGRGPRGPGALRRARRGGPGRAVRAQPSRSRCVRLIEEGRFMAFPDALRFILAVKGAGIRVAAASSSKNAELFLERIRLDTFAAEQRLDYDFIGPGMTLAGAVRRRHLRPRLPQGQARPGHLPHRRPGTRGPPGRLLRGRGRQQWGGGGQGRRHGGAGGGPPRRPGPARRGRRRPGRAHPGRRLAGGAGRGSPGGAAGRGGAAPAAHRAAAERLDAGLRRLRPRPPGAAGGAVRGRQRLLRDPRCPARGSEPTRSTTRAPMSPACTTGSRPRSPGAGSRTRTWCNVPNWLPLAFRVAGGPWFDVAAAEVLEHRLELDLRQGTLTRRLRWQDAKGRRTSMVQRRLVSMKDQHLAGLETTFTAENWSGTLQVRSGLDGRVVNAGVKRYRDLNGRHLAVLHAGEADAETIELQVETNQSHVRVALAARTRLLRDGQAVQADRRLVSEPGFVAHELGVRAGGGAAGDGGEGRRPLHLPGPRHLREPAGRAPGGTGGRRASPSCWPGTRAPGASCGTGSTSSWTAPTSGPRPSCTCTSSTCCRPSRPTPSTWTSACRRAAGTARPTGATSSGTRCSSSRSSTSSGRSLASALLDYRHARLPAARAAAREAGYQGAMFPWQSGSNGREETQQLHLNPKSGRWLPDHSHLQRHVNIAIAYNVWQHYWSPAAPGSCASSAPSCWSRSPGSGPASPPATPRRAATRSSG